MTRRAGAALIGLIAALLAVVPSAAPAWAGSLARTMPAQIGPPTGLTATAVSNSEIDLSWTAPSGDTAAVGYNVWYGTTPDTQDTSANSDIIQDTTYQVMGLNSCQAYYFEVDSIDSGGNIASSIVVPARTSCSPVSSGASSGGGSSAQLAAPTGLKATAVSGSEIDLTWTPPAGDTPAGGYYVYYGTAQGQENTQDSSDPVQGTALQVTGLDGGQTYFFVVDAADATGNESDYSNEADATTLSQPGSNAAAVSPAASSGSSSGQLGIILPLIFAGAGAGALIAWRRRRKRRPPAPRDTPAPHIAPASSVHAVAHAAPPGVVVSRPTGTDPTLTVRIESHKAPSITTIEEVPPR